MSDPDAERRLVEEAINHVVTDILLMRQELGKHDVSEKLRDAILAASAPGFVITEIASRMDELE